jgi:hypothetical protein
MASRFPRRGGDWSVEARRKELSELTCWELALASFALFSFLFCFFFFCLLTSLSKKSLEYIFFVCYHFFSRTDCYLSQWVGRSDFPSASGTAVLPPAAADVARSSVETIWQGKSQGAVM